MTGIGRAVSLLTVSAVLATGSGFAQNDHRDDQRNDHRNDHRNDQRNDHRDDRGDANRRDDHHDNRAYVRHDEWRKGYHMQHNDWDRGERIDYRTYRLRRPPRGYEWRQVDGNYVMAAVATGIVATVIAASLANH